MSRKTIAQTLEEQRVLITNSTKPQVAPLLAEMGMDEPHLKVGIKLYQTVLDLSKTQKKEYQEQDLAYDIYHQHKTECQATQKKNKRIAKLASRKDVELQNRIKVNASKETRIEEWIKQSIEFINLVLNEPGLLTSLVKYKITADSLTKSIKDLEKLKSLRNEAVSEKGQAQEATRIRNEQMEQLEDYCYELKTIATLALENQPQLLEMLGVIVPN